MQASLRSLALVVVFGSFAIGCGGDDAAVSNPGNDGSTGFDAAGGDDASGGMDTGTGDDATSGNDGTTGNDGGNGDGSSGTDGGRDSAPMGDPGIYCGKNGGQNVYCNSANQVCCFNFGGPGTTDAGSTCVASNQPCPVGETNVHCDDTADCVNGVCCGIIAGGNRYTDMICRVQCNQGEIRFCDPNVVVDGGAPPVDGGPPPKSDCPQGTACNPSQAAPGFHICR
jgi:hypothetical protein